MSESNHLFYLQLFENLDETFVSLSELLIKFNLYLVPIKKSELDLLKKSQKPHLVVLRRSLSEHFAFNDCRKTMIDDFVINARVNLYDISSFGEIAIPERLMNRHHYKHIPLPANLSHIATTLALDYYKEKNNRNEWPGGRRAKLPIADN